MHYAYPNGVEAIRGLTLDFLPGERVALLGENGSGKTTLARLLLGLLRPTQGTIWLEGRDTSQLTTHEITRDVGLVFQNPDHQIFLERVRDEVAFGPRNLGQPPPEVEERVETELRRFDLWKARHRLPAALSGGERKSVALASSFVLQPAVLLLDEPTKGMDYGRKRHLATIARTLTQEDKTVVFITHDLEFAYESSDRVVILRRGRVFLEGRTAEVFAHPSLAEAGLHPPEIPRLLALMEERGIDPSSRLYREVSGHLRGSA